MYFSVSNVPLSYVRSFKSYLGKLYYSKQHNLKQILLTMPRDTGHTEILQKQRQKCKVKGQKYTPGTVSLQVLGSGAKGAPRSLYVFTDQSRYLFNCGEGTQRLAHEHKMKLSKLEHIFITHPTWENIGGLPGLALTIQDVGVPEITLHGPAGTDEIFRATQRFVILKYLSVKMACCPAGGYFEDSVMTVHYLPITSTTVTAMNDLNDNMENPQLTAGGQVVLPGGTDNKEESDDVDYYAHERKRKKYRHSVDRSSETKRLRSDARKEPVALSYICQLKPRPGTLCLERCVDRRVPPGPLLGKLKAGEDVTLPDGTLVKSADVRLPDDPGPIFIVVDCPSLDYVDSLVNNSAFSRHQAAAASEIDLAFLVVHFTPESVMKDSRYRQWMEQFSPSTYQLTINESNSCMGSVAVHRIQHKLHLLHQGIFPFLQDTSIPLEDTGCSEENGIVRTVSVPEQDGKERDSLSRTTSWSEDGGSPDLSIGEEGALIKEDSNDITERSLTSYKNDSNIFSLIQARTFCSIHLRPRRGVDRQGELKLFPKQYIEETRCVDGFPEVLAELKQMLMETQVDPLRKFPQVLFLGTGSCIPNKTRNTSSILIHTSKDDCILLDCGEGTYGQLVRFYGPREVDAVLRKLRAVFISHLHADHHIGLVGLLKGRKRALPQSQVFLIAPRQIMSWLNLYHCCFEPVLQEFMLVANGVLQMGMKNIKADVYSQLLASLHMSDISTVSVRHCPNAFGVAFSHSDGWKITYSGDTMPCDDLVELGIGSDLLIHEATMEDELLEEAQTKLHSTTSQAIEMGQRMGAKFTLLTHFSQRYARLPRFNANFTKDVGVAFDNMQVCGQCDT
ncbi:ribonuclease Z, mitochondrial-like [Zootermopsis nevadensis]|uniref:ribonuclease Z, mitochondrial-like n=1 Tax=Zootermopsis nevadensis TaxID=136037 RepID=UPI000B8E478F|nr:ribonuclease Z, mitochondrial-like [Zootermopsis nevadensis]